MLEPRHGAFVEHFTSAMRLYRERQRLYSQVSGGRTDRLFRQIRFKQVLACPAACILDAWARKYQRAGIPILDLDFVDMREAPPFVAREAAPWPGPQDFYRPDIDRDKKTMLALIRKNNFVELLQFVEESLGTLAGYPQTNAFYRHFLESIGRMSYLAPFYIRAAEKRKLSSPCTLIRAALGMHIVFLDDADRVDRVAFPFQSEGIPLLVRDVPAIPLRPNLPITLS